MPTRPISVKPHLPHPALPGANWADCYELQVRAPGLSAVQVADMILSRFPLWVRLLMRLRNAVVGVFGLKSSEYHSPEAMEMIGFFPVVSKSGDQVVLGFDDKHLDFRIVIDVRDGGSDRRVVDVTTLVKRNILLGKVYIAAITPFHKLIVSTMLTRLGRRIDAVNSAR
ncbi:MAG: DUF2867 domain-containing protein [Rhizobiaceae bacterium]|nr:DUF2867 domain-containing protein [Rhizobiaceae bacterium]